jgi:hypothetical protein
MKKFCVLYNTTTSYDTVVVAENEKEARVKVKEVIGEPVNIESVWEIGMETQKEMIREAMEAIAARKPGRSKLVYDKQRRTIVAVSDTDQTGQGLNISAEDADRFFR